MRLCKKCRRILPEADFYASSGKLCKTCKAEQNHANRRRNQYGGGWMSEDKNPNGHAGSLRQRVMKLPYGHPMRGKFYANKKVWGEYYRFLERWGKDGGMSRPGASVR